MRRRTLLAAACGLALPAQAADGPVDVRLVLAVDVSRSIDYQEARLQREGYRSAMSDPAVIAAITGGPLGAIAVAYVEWAGFTTQNVVIPWTRIGNAADAEAWSARLAKAPRDSQSRTSISGALRFSGRLLAACPWEGTHQVIDVSGDGVNNHGPPAEGERDKLIAQGVTINGLPIVNDRPNFGMMPEGGLEAYYRDSVIGGPGAFLIAAASFADFGQAIRRKLIAEIAWAASSPSGRGMG